MTGGGERSVDQHPMRLQARWFGVRAGAAARCSGAVSGRDHRRQLCQDLGRTMKAANGARLLGRGPRARTASSSGNCARLTMG